MLPEVTAEKHSDDPFVILICVSHGNPSKPLFTLLFLLLKTKTELTVCYQHYFQIKEELYFVSYSEA